MLKWFGLVVITVIVGTIGYLYFYLGANRPVVVRVENYPSLQLAYREHVGAYHEINSVLVEIEQAFKKQGINCTKTFGLYLDNPETTDQDRLRSEVGCVLEGLLTAEQTQSLEVLQKEIPSRKYVYGRFDGSPAIGPFVVYPKLKSLAESQRLALDSWAIEIYNLARNGQLITEYLMPAE